MEGDLSTRSPFNNQIKILVFCRDNCTNSMITYRYCQKMLVKAYDCTALFGASYLE